MVMVVVVVVKVVVMVMVVGVVDQWHSLAISQHETMEV